MRAKLAQAASQLKQHSTLVGDTHSSSCGGGRHRTFHAGRCAPEQMNTMLPAHAMWSELPLGARHPHRGHVQQHNRRLRAQACMPQCRAAHISSSTGASVQLFPSLVAKNGNVPGWGRCTVSDAVQSHLPGRAGRSSGNGAVHASFAPRMDNSTTAAYPPHLRSSAQLLGRSSTTSAAAQLASPSPADALQHAAARLRGTADAVPAGNSIGGEAAAINGLAAARVEWPRALDDWPSQEEDSHSDRVGHQAGHTAAAHST